MLSLVITNVINYVDKVIIFDDTFYNLLIVLAKVDFLQKLGAAIAKKRTEAGMNQAQFALRCDMDRQNMSRIEKGKTNPTILTLKMIADELKIPLKDLLEFD